jgi:SAM-dependent methyltransferase
VKDYVKDYFDRHAEAWVEQAYVGDELPQKFPVGPERVRVALESVAPSVPDGGALVDLGCGGGQLVLHAAKLGWRAVGVDQARGMIEESQLLTEGLGVELVEAPYDASGLEDASFEAVTAIGLIEYLPDDDGLLLEVTRLLKPGGRFAVSCRNRLYNLASANAYTERELQGGDADELLTELRSAVSSASGHDLRALARELAAAADDLERAADLDGEGADVDLLDHPTMFAEERRQHTPARLRARAQAAGLSEVAVYPIHPHPFPAGSEPLAPRVYNRVALAWQRALEGRPLGLAFCSAFVSTFEKPA